MNMVHIGSMGMPVLKSRVSVDMGMWLPRWINCCMAMLVMFIMAVSVGVRHPLMNMRVLVPLGDVEPTPTAISAAAPASDAVTGSLSASTAAAAPKNGAVEKYAPVRAAPK